MRLPVQAASGWPVSRRGCAHLWGLEPAGLAARLCWGHFSIALCSGAFFCTEPILCGHEQPAGCTQSKPTHAAEKKGSLTACISRPAGLSWEERRAQELFHHEAHLQPDYSSKGSRAGSEHTERCSITWASRNKNKNNLRERDCRDILTLHLSFGECFLEPGWEERSQLQAWGTGTVPLHRQHQAWGTGTAPCMASTRPEAWGPCPCMASTRDCLLLAEMRGFPRARGAAALHTGQRNCPATCFYYKVGSLHCIPPSSSCPQLCHLVIFRESREGKGQLITARGNDTKLKAEVQGSVLLGSLVLPSEALFTPQTCERKHWQLNSSSHLLWCFIKRPGACR